MSIRSATQFIALNAVPALLLEFGALVSGLRIGSLTSKDMLALTFLPSTVKTFHCSGIDTVLHKKMQLRAEYHKA